MLTDSWRYQRKKSKGPSFIIHGSSIAATHGPAMWWAISANLNTPRVPEHRKYFNIRFSFLVIPNISIMGEPQRSWNMAQENLQRCFFCFGKNALWNPRRTNYWFTVLRNEPLGLRAVFCVKYWSGGLRPTWRIVPVSKCLVGSIYHPFRPSEQSQLGDLITKHGC